MNSSHCYRRLVSASRASKEQVIPSIRQLHASTSKPATPLPHPSAPGPPPKPPVPAASYTDERLARKKKQAELIKLGQSLRADPKKPASVLQKRFWKDVTLKETSDGYQILLDGRPVRTSSKIVLTIPQSKRQLALGIALEWDLLVTAQQALKQHYIPLTSLASRAMDIELADMKRESSVRDAIVKMAMSHLSTDTLLCWAPEKNIHDDFGPKTARSLRRMQEEAVQPLLSFLTTHVWPGVEIQPVLQSDSIVPTPQPETTTEVIRGWLSGLPAFELAGLERGVLASRSLLVAARLLVEWSQEFAHLWNKDQAYPRFGIEEAAEACTLEVRWQTGMWGEVEDTHDVDKEDVRRQLGSVVLLVTGTVDH